jgi:transposase
MEEFTTRAAMEANRRLAVKRVAAGLSCKQVAEVLGVHVETVRLWVRTHKALGDAGLQAKPPTGRPRFLTPRQEAQVRRWLTQKPTQHGFRTDLWTARRVAELIRQRFGVEYHPGYLREWLSQRGYTPQKPTRPAKERDPKKLERWLQTDWPELQKKAPTTQRTSSSSTKRG